MTAFFNLGSLALGLGAWALACLAIISKKAFASYLLSVSSLSVCAVSLLFQILEISHRVDIGDFSAIADTIRSIVFASRVLIVTTVILNTVAVAVKANTNK